MAATKAKDTSPMGVAGDFTVGLVMLDAPDAPLDPMRRRLPDARGRAKVTSWAIRLPRKRALFDTMGTCPLVHGCVR